MLINPPLEILTEILTHLDFESIIPLLTAIPSLKKQTIIVRRSKSPSAPLYDIPGVQVYRSFPRNMKEEPGLHGRSPILILCVITQEDILEVSKSDCLSRKDTESISHFTASIFERIKRTKAAMFVHAFPAEVTKWYPLAYIEAKTELIRKGVKFKESLDPRIKSWVDASRLLSESFEDQRAPKYIRITGRHCFNKVFFRSVVSLSVEFPRCSKSDYQCFLNITAPELRDLSIGYRSVLPDIRNIYLSSNVSADRQRYFSLVDLDTEAWNVSPPHRSRAERISAEGPVDVPVLAFTKTMTCITLVGGHINILLRLIHFDSCSCLNVVERDTLWSRKYTNFPVNYICAPKLRSFRWQTNLPGSHVPVVLTRKYLKAYLFSSVPGLQYSLFLEQCAWAIYSLTLHTRPSRGDTQQITRDHVTRMSEELIHLSLSGVSAPFLSNKELSFPRAGSVRLADITRPSGSLDVLDIRCFRDSHLLVSLSFTRQAQEAYNSATYDSVLSVGPTAYCFSGITGTFEMLGKKMKLDFRLEKSTYSFLHGDKMEKMALLPVVDI